MTDQEYIMEQRRVRDYQSLSAIRSYLHEAMRKITEPWPDGPHGQGPFTGNTRESRSILTIAIKFSPTLGGSPEVQTEIQQLNIPAWDFGIALKRLLEEKLKRVQEEIEKL